RCTCAASCAGKWATGAANATSARRSPASRRWRATTRVSGSHRTDLDQALGPERYVALAPDDHVVVDGDPEVSSGLHDALGDLDIGTARLGAAARVVVHEDERGGAEV